MRNEHLQFSMTWRKLRLIIVILLISPLASIAQSKTVQGTVTDGNGESLPGVNVLIKGTNTGTITDLDGRYSINAASGDVLSFSFVGFRVKEIVIGTRNRIDVTMEEDVSELEEVVVIGYGTVKKRDLTGSVSSVDPDELNLGSASNIEEVMTGRVPGVQVNQNSAEPGGSVNVRIRGASSINAGNEPLYVIDGMPIDNSPVITGTGAGVTANRNTRNPLNMINPNDIESIEILKDASATAIYGSRGANGVIMITTKKGSDKKTAISYDGAGSIQKVARKVDVLSATEYASVINDIAVAEGGAPIYDMNEVNDQSDWLDEVTRTGYVQNHNLSVSGGSSNSNFYSSVNYFKQDGVVISSGMERLTARLNAEFNAGEKFRYGVNLTNSYIKNDNVPFGTGFNAGGGVIYTALEMDPTLPKFNEDGTPFQSFDIDMDNPLIIAGIFAEEESSRILGSAFGEYSIIPELKFKINVGFDKFNSRKDTYVQSYTKIGINNGSGIATIITGERSSKLLENTLNYAKSLDNHNLNILAGFTYQDFVNRGFNGNIDGFTSDVLLTNNFGLGNTENDDLNSYKNTNTLISYLGRVNYNYLSKYYLTASIRADGSSRFGENNKFGYFPSLAFSWRLSEEAFLKDVDFISNLKLRTSWGKTGNQEIGNYASLPTLGSGGLALLNGQQVQGIASTRIPNPDLQWETTTQTDIGVDMELFAGRVNLVADYFIKKTDDLLLNLPLPKSSGFNSILTNIGSVRNSGFELFLESYNVDKNDFRWATTVTFTRVRNEVLDIGSRDQIFQGGLPFTPDITVVQVGSPLNSYYGHVVEGIWQEGDDIAGSAQPNAQPGYPKFKDISGPEGVPDGVINDDDKTTIGSPFPDFSLGLRNTFNYKRWNLDVFFAGDFGQELLNQNLLYSLYPIELRRNRLAEPLLNRWTLENPTNQWPSGVIPNSYGGSTINSLSIEDATFFRLRNARLGYSFNTDNIGFINAANIYIQGSNLLLFTDYMGFDPEVNALDNRANSARADYNSYPNARTYTLGFRLTF
jgi:TonB-linked SusC/RagA family outer membrane protein